MVRVVRLWVAVVVRAVSVAVAPTPLARVVGGARGGVSDAQAGVGLREGRGRGLGHTPVLGSRWLALSPQT